MFDIPDRQEQDEKEFEEWWATYGIDRLYSGDLRKEWCREAWLASRRSLRECIEELKESLDFWKKDAGLEQSHSILCEKRVKELEEDLKLNATMLAKQTDLAREAEIRVMELETRNKELEEGIEKHYRDNKISCVESDGSISTAKCRGLEELYKLVGNEELDDEKESNGTNFKRKR